MLKNSASLSAGLVAGARALESLAPKKRRIIDDPYAAYFVTGRFEPLSKYAKTSLAGPLAYRLITFYTNTVLKRKNGAIAVALRHRFIDDKLSVFLNEGYQQVVLLGAGFDSRAIRFARNNVRFIEIDHPATQEEKLKRLEKFSDLPDRDVTYLATDFHENWLERIMEREAIKPEPSIFIWEGVSMYLSEEAIEYTLQGIKKLSPKGHLLFDAITTKALELWNSTANEGMNSVIRPDEEPFLFGIDEEQLEPFLNNQGFQSVAVTNAKGYAEAISQRENVKVNPFDGGNNALYVHASYSND